MKTFNLTYSQAKLLIENHGRNETERFCSNMNDQPEFLNENGVIDSVSELISLYESGCMSNAHWSCYYSHALKCMSEYSESVEAQIESFGSIEYNVENDTFAQFCSKLCQMAVENFVHDQEDFIETLKESEY